MDTTRNKISTLKKPKTQKETKKKKQRKKGWSSQLEVIMLAYCRYPTSEVYCNTKSQIALAETTFEFLNFVILEDLI